MATLDAFEPGPYVLKNYCFCGFRLITLKWIILAKKVLQNMYRKLWTAFNLVYHMTFYDHPKGSNEVGLVWPKIGQNIIVVLITHYQ